MSGKKRIIGFVVIFLLLISIGQINRQDTVHATTQPNVSVSMELVTYEDFRNPDGTFYPYDPITVVASVSWSVPENTTDLEYSYDFDARYAMQLNREVKMETIRLQNKTVEVPVQASLTLTYYSAGDYTIRFWIQAKFTIGNETVTKGAEASVSVKYVNPPLPTPVALYPTLNNTFILLLRGESGKRIMITPDTLRTLALVNNNTKVIFVREGNKTSEKLLYDTVLYEDVLKPDVKYLRHPVTHMPYFTTKNGWLKIVLTTNMTAPYLPVTFIVQVRNSTMVKSVFLNVIPYAQAKTLRLMLL